MANITVLNTSSDLSSKTLLSAEQPYTITGLLTFSRSPSAPFAVQASSANVTNLDADLLDGEHASAIHNAANLTGTIASGVQDAITRLGTIVSGAWNGTKIGLAYGGTNADLSATGGSNQVLKQVTLGGAVTVGTLAIANLSDGSNAALLNAANTFSAANPIILGSSANGTIRTDDAGYLHLQGGSTGFRLYNNGNSSALLTITDGGILTVNQAGRHFIGPGGTTLSTALRLDGGNGTGLGSWISFAKAGTDKGLIGSKSAILGSGTSDNLVLWAPTGSGLDLYTNAGSSLSLSLSSTGAATFLNTVSATRFIGATYQLSGAGVALSNPSLTSIGITFNFTESGVGVGTVMPHAGAASNFYVVTGSSQPGTGALTLTVNKNGSPTALVITVAAGSAAGTFSDTTHSVSFSAGDVLSITVANAATSTSASYSTVGCMITVA